MTVRQITGTVTCQCDPDVHGGGGDPNDPGNEPTVYTTDPVSADGGGLPGAVLATLRNDVSVGDGQRFCGGGVNGMGLCRDDATDAQNCVRTYISDLIPLDLDFQIYRMMVYDLGSAKRGLRMYTAIDHWDGNPQSFVDGCCGLPASFVTQDVMEYSVWGTNVDPGDPAFMTMASWVKLSDVVGYDNSQAAIDAGGPFYSFDGNFGGAAAAPTVVYTQGGGGCGIINGYSRDYVFCNAYQFVGVRSSTISMLEPDADPELDAVYGWDPDVNCVGACGCSTVISNIAELTCEDNSLIEGSPASASFDVTCDEEPGQPLDFCSQTQGGWGQDSCNPGPDPCAGGNVGCFRDCHFDDLFDDLIVGDPDGPDADMSYAILLSSSGAVANYLPTGGMPAALTQDQTDPETTSSGVFGGQLVAATLNVAVDDAGLRRDGEAQPFPAGTLGTLVYVDGCVDDDLVGLSVNQVIALANTAISGGGTPAGVTISDLSDALATLNQNFVDCDTNNGCLALP